jgi:hypothetical protein
MPLHVASHAVGPGPCAAALVEYLGYTFQVLLDQRIVAVAAQKLPEFIKAGIAGGGSDAIINEHTVPAVSDQACLLELGQVRRNAGLGQLGDCCQFRDAQFFPVEQQQQPQTGSIRQQPKMLCGALQVHGVFLLGAHISLYLDSEI